MRISGWSGDRALIRALDGDLDLQTSLTKGGRYEIESHSGNIQLALPEQPGFELDAQTFSGRIRVDFPVKSEGPSATAAGDPVRYAAPTATAARACACRLSAAI